MGTGLDQFLKPFTDLLREGALQILVNVADILVVAYLIYRVFALLRGIRAWRIVAGVLGFFLLLLVSIVLQLKALNWLLEKAALLLPVALVILLLPEFRQALENVGKLGRGFDRFVTHERRLEVSAVEEIVAAVAELSAARIGALIVIEKASPLNDIIGTGVMLDARLSSSLLGAIFQNGNPLHDGAAVIRNKTIVAGACQLPLSDATHVNQSYHMRHRAALGVSERYDATAIVVSEEKGSVSVATDGNLVRLTSPFELRDYLKAEMRAETPSPERTRKRSFARARQVK